MEIAVISHLEYRYHSAHADLFSAERGIKHGVILNYVCLCKVNVRWTNRKLNSVKDYQISTWLTLHAQKTLFHLHINRLFNRTQHAHRPP